MGMIKVTAEDLESVSSQINGGAQAINDKLNTLQSAVSNLVGGGWAGAASSQFEQLYTQWNQSAAQLNQALQGISKLLQSAATAYRQTEEQITKSMQG